MGGVVGQVAAEGSARARGPSCDVFLAASAWACHLSPAAARICVAPRFSHPAHSRHPAPPSSRRVQACGMFFSAEPMVYYGSTVIGYAVAFSLRKALSQMLECCVDQVPHARSPHARCTPAARTRCPPAAHTPRTRRTAARRQRCATGVDVVWLWDGARVSVCDGGERRPLARVCVRARAALPASRVAADVGRPCGGRTLTPACVSTRMVPPSPSSILMTLCMHAARRASCRSTWRSPTL